MPDPECPLWREPECPPGSPEWRVRATPEEVQEHEEQQRLAGLLRRHWPTLRPVLLELLVPDLIAVMGGLRRRGVA